MPQQNRRVKKKFTGSLEEVGKLHRGDSTWAEDFSLSGSKRNKMAFVGRRII